MHKADISLYLGGIRSGKSLFAENHVRAEAKGAVLYIATAESHSDAAMQERIKKHQARRPESWHTLECPLHIAQNIATALEDYAMIYKKPASKPTILLDCVTLWVSNILFALPDQNDLPLLESHVQQEVEALITLMQNTDCRLVIVSSETGLGGIASTQLERNYQDALGLANQIISSHSSTAFLCVAGRRLAL